MIYLFSFICRALTPSFYTQPAPIQNDKIQSLTKLDPSNLRPITELNTEIRRAAGDRKLAIMAIHDNYKVWYITDNSSIDLLHIIRSSLRSRKNPLNAKPMVIDGSFVAVTSRLMVFPQTDTM